MTCQTDMYGNAMVAIRFIKCYGCTGQFHRYDVDDNIKDAKAEHAQAIMGLCEGGLWGLNIKKKHQLRSPSLLLLF